MTTIAPAPAFSGESLVRAVQDRLREPLHIVRDRTARTVGVAPDDRSGSGRPALATTLELLGSLPPSYPEWLGDRSFGTAHGVRFPYVAGEMANAIATTDMVVAMSEAGMLGFFGAGGLGHRRVEAAVDELCRRLAQQRNWGVNLIHSPSEPALEERVAAMLVARHVPIVSASAFMALTPAVVHCSAGGLSTDRSGRVVRRTRLFAKVSRPEVAEQFMSPAPAELLDVLVTDGRLTREEARLAARIPVAEDVTAEADSGGHTDNRPLNVLLPVLLDLSSTLAVRFGCPPVRVGAAGGLGTPQAVAAAFAAGAAYVVTGTVNQVAVESGLSAEAKELLSAADIADVCMAPASDMFEAGVKVQVLRRGTLFAGRAGRLYEAYQAYDSLEEIPAALRSRFERDILRQTFEEAWAATRSYWLDRDAAEVSRAERDPRHRMALVFRSYLGLSSQWAISGEPSRRADYQIWCGPAMGSFNRWVRDTFLDPPGHPSVVQIARNLLEGAAVVTRAQHLRTLGVPVPPAAFAFRPRPLR
ncbi:PfaD family polyunsaturated fatty acid/polyketide biosynthesis protein [Streptomyces sp. NBC_01485]|uniref:PfaD family polyunsaturated fatty acid/polyketide biosynthesis protein n=1 Tax=Streptomyces sp. NBC_01485 TaxID=2903884 RepID=UPI002E3749F7|nr:PfaD family polyunsaturated fatty acid/polyketide biosynthesis protein [Streptomyces sp. NBC_01485]